MCLFPWLIFINFPCHYIWLFNISCIHISGLFTYSETQQAPQESKSSDSLDSLLGDVDRSDSHPKHITSPLKEVSDIINSLNYLPISLLYSQCLVISAVWKLDPWIIVVVNCIYSYYDVDGYLFIKGTSIPVHPLNYFNGVTVKQCCNSDHLCCTRIKFFE